MRIARAFFARPALEVAPEMLGLLLVHELADGTRLVGRIVEVEAYLGDGSDPASHSHNGPTPRTQPMFGPPGHFYVYRSMGIHRCANVVCEPAGRSSAVLLRAAEPLAGEERMRALRGGRGGRELASGPGRLAEAFAIELAHSGAEALRGPLRLERPARAAATPLAVEIVVGPRIGLTKAAELPYRFFVRGSPHVTRAAQNAHARPWRRAARAGGGH
ncbi:MAG TPA: DNA-3-methyladenine glycosylase [Myxococcota bacterium]|nr:DNA-3-methyladenine glycosylase [Myxococcota bacterium]